MNPTSGDQQTLPRPAGAPVTPVPLSGGTGAQLLSRFPPRSPIGSWSVTEGGRSEVLARLLTPPFALDNRGSQQVRRLSVLSVVNWLATQPGDTWQDRWRSGGAEDQQDWRTLVSGGRPASDFSPGLLVLICADVIRPSLGWLLNSPRARRNLAVEMARARDPGAFAALSGCARSVLQV